MSFKVLIVVAGPTAVGKTALAIHLAQYFNTEIISADSRQCYREITIGTAKPSEEELQAVKHHFIDSHSIFEPINAAAYERLALGYLEEIFSKKDIAIVSGGTGLYIKALCEGIDEMPQTDVVVIQEVIASYEKNGMAWLQSELSKLDPDFFQVAEQNNPHRLIRALSFRRSTGKSIRDYRSGHKKERPFHILKIGLELDRTELYERINLRVEQMMAHGLLKEAMPLLRYRHLKNLNTVGYAELFDYFEEKIALDEAISRIKQHTRNYAKRQMTWFKKDKGFVWFSPRNEQGLISYLDREITRLKLLDHP